MKSKKNKNAGELTRREFLKSSLGLTASAALVWPQTVPSSMLAASAPSNRITIGCIGVGRMGLGDMREILGFDQAQVVAVCDVDSKRVEHARQMVQDHYGTHSKNGSYKGCAAYRDFRELLVRSDIDAVLICTPDHWHAMPAVAAAKVRKDIFLEKPPTRTIQEGRVLSDTVRRYARILQVGSQHAPIQGSASPASWFATDASASCTLSK